MKTLKMTNTIEGCIIVSLFRKNLDLDIYLENII